MMGLTPARRGAVLIAGGPQGQQGIALIMVLWLVVLLTIVAASFATHSRVETRMAGNLVERQKARLLIQTGFSRALLELMAASSDERWKVDGEIHELQQAQGSLRIAIRNAAGLVDLNRASHDVLYNLFSLLSDDQEIREQLVDALNDWRDGDDLKRLNGAEDDDYAHAGLDYGTVDRDLESVDELGYVIGFDQDSVDRLRPYVTVYSGLNQIDRTYASQELVDILKSGDASLDGQVAQAFDQLDSGLADINELEEGLDGLGKAQSSNYRISIEATTEGGGHAVVDVDVEMGNLRDRPFKVLAWHTRY
ncbi:MAG: type II secretion system protein GspK [Candidatus Thiodiazotropha sp.]|jgi:general secretion pathway protein K